MTFEVASLCVTRLSLEEFANALGLPAPKRSVESADTRFPPTRRMIKRELRQLLVREVLALSFHNPEWGATRIQKALAMKGQAYSRETIQQILIDNDRGRVEKRLLIHKSQEMEK